MFVLAMLNGKKNGSFLEIGGGDPFHGNNTALLEKEFDWKGVTIEIEKVYCDKYRETRPQTRVLNQDALEVDYKAIIGDDSIIDYLQLDIEPARTTLQCLYQIPFDSCRFRVITYEHDHYVDTSKKCRDASREYLKSKGYILVVPDVSVDDQRSFEDWWAHPDLVDAKILKMMKKDATNVKSYMIGQ